MTGILAEGVAILCSSLVELQRNLWCQAGRDGSKNLEEGRVLYRAICGEQDMIST